MRKNLLFLLIGLPFIFVACNNATTETASEAKTENSAADKNLASFHIVADAFESGDISKIDSAVAADFVDHTERGDQGRDSLKARIVSMHQQMPDMKSEVVKELADGEYVFGILRYTGTSKGQMGMPPGPFDFNAMEVVRFKDGKAVEHWGYMEPRVMMKMMPPPADAGKK